MPTYVRKDHRNCTPAERDRFLDAVLELKKTPSAKPHPANSHGTVHGDFVATHYDAFFSGIAHASPNFLPWHRQFLIEFEIALNRTAVARGKPYISVPYWNWIVDRDATASPWVPEWLGGNGTGLLGQVQTGRFGVPDSRLPELLSEASMTKLRAAGKIRDLPAEESGAIWAELNNKLRDLPAALKEIWLVHQVVDEEPFLIRDFDRPLGSALPFHHRETKAEMEARRAQEGEWFRDRGLGLLDVMDTATYDVFAARFESDQHGMPHMALAGHMGSAGSPNDPAFWFHHSFVDKIWCDWQAKQRRENPAEAPYLPLIGGNGILGYADTFGPWSTHSAKTLIDTTRIRHPQAGRISYTYR
ncbi:tyrosinase family protein [Kribbella antibiotica]|nr:tyrosinase family protein [Kribbella antibiotica]